MSMAPPSDLEGGAFFIGDAEVARCDTSARMTVRGSLHGQLGWTLVALGGVVSGCGHTPPSVDPLQAAKEPALEAFNNDEVLATYEDMAARLKMPGTVRVLLAERLKGVLANPDFEPKRDGIQGVLVYSGIEGGLVVKISSGDGLVGFKNRPARRVTLKSTSIGAQVGGSQEWGIGLILGLSRAGYFGGEYVGSSAGATLITASATVQKLRPARPSSNAAKHRIYAIGRATGASADAGGVRMTIVYRDL